MGIGAGVVRVGVEERGEIRPIEILATRATRQTKRPGRRLGDDGSRGEIDPRASLGGGEGGSRGREPEARDVGDDHDDGGGLASRRLGVSCARGEKHKPGRARGRDALERAAVRRDPRRRDARRPEETSRRARGVPDARKSRRDVNRPVPVPVPVRVRVRISRGATRIIVASHRQVHHERGSTTLRGRRVRAPRPARSDVDAARGNRGDGDPGRRDGERDVRSRGGVRSRVRVRSSSAEGYDIDARGASRRCFASEERGGDASAGAARRGCAVEGAPVGRRGGVALDGEVDAAEVRGDAGGGVRGEGCVGSGRDDEVDDGVLGGGEFNPVDPAVVAHGERGESEHAGSRRQRTADGDGVGVRKRVGVVVVEPAQGRVARAGAVFAFGACAGGGEGESAVAKMKTTAVGARDSAGTGDGRAHLPGRSSGRGR